jgi:hypothetical protein
VNNRNPESLKDTRAFNEKFTLKKEEIKNLHPPLTEKLKKSSKTAYSFFLKNFFKELDENHLAI